MLHHDQVTSLPNKVKPGKPSQITFHQKCKISISVAIWVIDHQILHKNSVTEADFLYSVITLGLKILFCWVEKQEKM